MIKLLLISHFYDTILLTGQIYYNSWAFKQGKEFFSYFINWRSYFDFVSNTQFSGGRISIKRVAKQIGPYVRAIR